MQALIVVDAQNEFSSNGKRPVPNFYSALDVINERVRQARSAPRPIAWVRHFNRPDESPAFVPGSWGAEFPAGLGPLEGNSLEKEFHKDVYGAFTGSAIGEWLKEQDVDEVLIMGFYTHGCVSTTTREAIMRDLKVMLDPNATGTCDLQHELLGRMTADEVRRSALLQLVNMGARLSSGLAFGKIAD
jgi:nicotinamidase-related amidase